MPQTPYFTPQDEVDDEHREKSGAISLTIFSVCSAFERITPCDLRSPAPDFGDARLFPVTSVLMLRTAADACGLVEADARVSKFAKSGTCAIEASEFPFRWRAAYPSLEP